MSESAATSGVANATGGRSPGLTPAAIEAVLDDFRTWLVELACGDRAVAGESEGGETLHSPEPVDLFTLLAQFTALRHEVNMQTRAARAAVEQSAEVLKRLEAADGGSRGDDGESLRPCVKAFVDTADALALSLRQMEKLRESAEPLLADLAAALPVGNVEVPKAPKPGILGTIFGASTVDLAPLTGWVAAVKAAEAARVARSSAATDKLRQLIAAAADGYALSLRRIERVLPVLEIELIPSLGNEFDPELMEVVEVVGDEEHDSGTVVDEVRPGYRWRGKVLRYAQVKVNR